MGECSVTAPDDTKENVLLEIRVPAHPAPGSRLKLRCVFRYTSDANVKSLRVRYSGPYGTLLAFRHATSTKETEFNIDLVFLDAWRQVSTCEDRTDGIVTKHLPVECVVDTERPSTILVTAQKAVVRDNITLEFCSST